jgi:hypothetical protein
MSHSEYLEHPLRNRFASDRYRKKRVVADGCPPFGQKRKAFIGQNFDQRLGLGVEETEEGITIGATYFWIIDGDG